MSHSVPGASLVLEFDFFKTAVNSPGLRPWSACQMGIPIMSRARITNEADRCSLGSGLCRRVRRSTIRVVPGSSRGTPHTPMIWGRYELRVDRASGCEPPWLIAWACAPWVFHMGNQHMGATYGIKQARQVLGGPSWHIKIVHQAGASSCGE